MSIKPKTTHGAEQPEHGEPHEHADPQEHAPAAPHDPATPHDHTVPHDHPTPVARPTKPVPIRPVQDDPALNPAFHRRILDFINQAVYPEDLIYPRASVTHAHGGGMHQGNPLHEDNPAAMHEHRPMLMKRETARRLIELRDREFPLGFRNIKELWARDIFRLSDLLDLFDSLSDSVYGRWTVFPQPIPRRGPGSYDGIVHAALCHTGRCSSSPPTRRRSSGIEQHGRVHLRGSLNQPHTMTFPAPIPSGIHSSADTTSFSRTGSCCPSAVADTDRTHWPNTGSSSIRLRNRGPAHPTPCPRRSGIPRRTS